MISNILSLMFCCLVFLFSANSAKADDTFRWEDPSGQIFYGSHPPSNGKGVTKLKNNKVSHYSTAKAMAGYKLNLNNSMLEENLVDQSTTVDTPPETRARLTPEIKDQEPGTIDIAPGKSSLEDTQNSQ